MSTGVVPYGFQREGEPARLGIGTDQVRTAARGHQLHRDVRALPRIVARERHAALARTHHRPERQPVARLQARIGRRHEQRALDVVSDGLCGQAAAGPVLHFHAAVLVNNPAAVDINTYRRLR